MQKVTYSVDISNTFILLMSELGAVTHEGLSAHMLQNDSFSEVTLQACFNVMKLNKERGWETERDRQMYFFYFSLRIEDTGRNVPRKQKNFTVRYKY